MPQLPAFDNDKIKEILLLGDYVTEDDIKKAEEFAESHHASIIDYLITNEVITKDLLGQAIAESLNASYANLVVNKPLRENVIKIPEAIAKKYRAVFFSEDIAASEVTIATDNPASRGLKTELAKLFPGKKITIAYSLAEDIEENFIHYQKPLETRFGKIIQAQRQVAPEIIHEILGDALLYRASDVHFEPQPQDVVIRFRIDGMLHEAGRIPKEYYDNILNRIKVQAHLRIDEHFSAQDGAIRYERGDTSVDLRISIVPTLDGEKIAVRLLSHYVRAFTLADIGLSRRDQEILMKAGKKPFGMILVVGPTGSGKTTTLYALLKLLHDPTVNITTIEDPVEYKLIGVNQIQVNQGTNLTFAQGLRSIVRQDPNIILVGEIRDKETAEIGVNAALTGHLLLSTFHANDASTAVPRLLDMGIEPFLMASTIHLLIAQRLMRKLCDECRASYVAKTSEIKKAYGEAASYFAGETITLYRGKGCKTCNGTGFKGRTAVFEFISITREMQDLILKNPSTKQLWDLARKQGAISMFEDGLEKVRNGVTTLEELLRIAPPPRT